MDKRLIAVFSDVLGMRVQEITADLTKAGVAGWDSLKQMDMVMSIEREFDIVLEIADIVRMDSAMNIVAVLKEKGVDLED